MKFVLDEKIILGQGIFAKIFHGTLDSESIAAKRNVDRGLLFREAHFLKLCHHPNVIKYKGLIEFENQCYLLMELAQGNLQDLLGLRKFSSAEKVSLVRQIAFGLEHIHSKGIVHGDINPGNILFKNPHQVAIADFAMAQDYAAGVPVLSNIGIVPENASTPKSDVYLLALVAFQIFEDRKQVTRATLGAEIRNGGLSGKMFERGIWKRTIVNAVARDPEKRPTANEFYNAFRN